MAKKRNGGLPRKVLTYESKPPLLRKLLMKALIAGFGGSRKRMEKSMNLMRVWLTGATEEIREKARKELLSMKEYKKRKPRLK